MNFGIPYLTLQETLHVMNLEKYGGQTVLKNEEETELAVLILKCANWSFPLRRRDITQIVQQFLNQ